MRAFLAIRPPEHVITDLDTYLEPRRLAEDDWRWSRPEQFHLTLAFLADLPDHRLDELVATGEAWAARQQPLPMRLSGAGAFPDPARAKVLWVSVPATAGDVLTSWSRSWRDAASHVGADVDGVRFTPHLTVARSGRARSAGRITQALDAYRSESFTVTEVELVRSHLGDGPRRSARHEQLHRFRL